MGAKESRGARYDRRSRVQESKPKQVKRPAIPVRTGTQLHPVLLVYPRPSWPCRFQPQFTRPPTAAVKAHVCCAASLGTTVVYSSAGNGVDDAIRVDDNIWAEAGPAAQRSNVRKRPVEKLGGMAGMRRQRARERMAAKRPPRTDPAAAHAVGGGSDKGWGMTSAQHASSRQGNFPPFTHAPAEV